MCVDDGLTGDPCIDYGDCGDDGGGTGDPCIDYGDCGGGGGTNPTNPPPAPDPCRSTTTYSKDGTRILSECGNYDIHNDIDDPCLRRVTEAVISGDIQYDIQQSLRSIFGTTDKVNLYYRDVSDLPSNVAGEASYQTKDIPNEVNIKIVLNQNTLPDASQEYIVSTIVHESLHAYFRYKNTDAELDHENMASNYISWFMEIMSRTFPNIPQSDNYALAWGGLGETAAWDRKSPTERNAIADTDNSYRQREKGTNPCP